MQDWDKQNFFLIVKEGGGSVLPDLEMRTNFVSFKFKLSLFVFREDIFISARRHSEEKNLVQAELAFDIAAALFV